MKPVVKVTGAEKTVSAALLAKVLDLSTARLRQLADEGSVKRAGRNQYHLKESIQGYLASLHASRERAAAKSQSSRALNEARVREIEARTAQRADKLMHVSESVASFDLFIGMFRKALAPVSKRVGRNDDERTAIKKELDAVITQLAAHRDKRVAEMRSQGFVIDDAGIAKALAIGKQLASGKGSMNSAVRKTVGDLSARGFVVNGSG